MVPALLFLVPDSNFDLRFVIGRVNVLWESEYNIDWVFLHESTRVRERNIPQSLFNGQDASHHPLVGTSALFWISVHLEVDDATDDDVILYFGCHAVLLLVGCQSACLDNCLGKDQTAMALHLHSQRYR